MFFFVGVIFDLDNTFFIVRHVLFIFWGGRGGVRLESSCIQVSMVYVNVRKMKFHVIIVIQSHGHS
jgi:hypothetical protein